MGKLLAISLALHPKRRNPKCGEYHMVLISSVYKGHANQLHIYTQEPVRVRTQCACEKLL